LLAVVAAAAGGWWYARESPPHQGPLLLIAVDELSLVGGNLALDFANTQSGPPGGEPDVESLSSYEDFVAWAVRVGAVDLKASELARDACYLASGKPVVAQDTGFSNILPTGEGLFAFTTADQAVAAIDEINSDYARHCAAARAIAEEFFEARGVAARLLEAAGL